MMTKFDWIAEPSPGSVKFPFAERSLASRAYLSQFELIALKNVWNGWGWDFQIRVRKRNPARHAVRGGNPVVWFVQPPEAE